MIELVGQCDVSANDFLALESSVTEYPWKLSHFEHSLANDDRIFCVQESGLLRAYAIFSLAADEATLLNIAVTAKSQGQGLGKRLLQHGLDALQAEGATTCFLEVRASNQQAQYLYHAFGFYEVGRRAGYYPSKQGREDAVNMLLPLVVDSEQMFKE